MSVLKRYIEFINEEAEPTEATVQSPGLNVETIDKLFVDLKDVIQKRIEENKKLINGYYNTTTKDQQEINTTDEYYTYGRYNGNFEEKDKDKNRNMVFTIKLSGSSEGGLTFTVVKSDDLPDVKIEAKDIEIAKKGVDGSIKFNPGFINGKYVVKDKGKINLLKPKEESTSKQPNTPTDTKEESSLITKDEQGIKEGEEYYNVYGKTNKDKSRTPVIAKIQIVKVNPTDKKMTYNILSDTVTGVYENPIPKQINKYDGDKMHLYKDLNKLLSDNKVSFQGQKTKITNTLNGVKKEAPRKLEIGHIYKYVNSKKENTTVKIDSFDKNKNTYTGTSRGGTVILSTDNLSNVGEETTEEIPKITVGKTYKIGNETIQVKSGPDSNGDYSIIINGLTSTPITEEQLLTKIKGAK